MRLDSALKNVKSTMIVYVIKTILQFAVRMVFVRVLPIEYLGINGLFSNILAVLALAELGIGPAIIFSLYKPLAVGDLETVKSLMRLFKKTYISIGIVILVLGAVLTPWLDFFIQGRPNIDYLEWIYLLFVLDTGISYFYSYKRNLLLADQKQFVANFYQGVFQVTLAILQMIFLVVTQSFWPFIILKVIATFLENVMVARKADTFYPILNSSNIKPLASDIKRTIVRNVEAMIFHKVGGIAVFSTSNIIISKFVGLTAVGLYSNYYLIINSIQSISWQIFGSLTASVGNLVAVEGQEKKIANFKVLQFMTAWIAFYTSIGLYVMFNPLIEMWLGKEYLFADSIVFVMVLNYYLTYMRRGVQTFKDAMGLFWNNRYMPIAETIINLTAGILLVQKFDIIGALLAMTFSTIFTCFWIEPYVVMRNGLDYPLKEYFCWYGIFSLLTVVVGYGLHLSYWRLWPSTTLFSLIGGIILCTLIANSIWILIFYRTKEFRYVWQLIKNRF